MSEVIAIKARGAKSHAVQLVKDAKVTLRNGAVGIVAMAARHDDQANVKLQMDGEEPKYYSTAFITHVNGEPFAHARDTVRSVPTPRGPRPRTHTGAPAERTSIPPKIQDVEKRGTATLVNRPTEEVVPPFSMEMLDNLDTDYMGDLDLKQILTLRRDVLQEFDKLDRLTLEIVVLKMMGKDPGVERRAHVAAGLASLWKTMSRGIRSAQMLKFQ